MKSRTLIFAAIALSSLVVTYSAPARETWTLVRSRNFLLVGNASERDIRRVGTRLEQFRDVFARLFTKARLNSPVPTTVIVFKSASSYKPFKPLYQGRPIEAAGYFQAGPDVNYITLTTEQQGENPFGVIFHELVHLFVQNNVPHAPLWFNEGLAEYYSSFEVSDGDRKVLLGKPIARHVFRLREQFIPLRTLFAVDHSSPLYNERDKSSIFYAESWAFVHYLILGNNGQRQKHLAQFVNLLATGTPVERSFTQAFQTDFQTMEKELRDYIRHDTYPVQVISFDERLEFDATMQSAPLSEAEAQAYLGDLLLHLNRLDEAEKYLQQALALDADLAIAHSSLGLLLVRQHRLADARSHLERAIAANSRNHLTHYYYAFALSREGMDANGRVSAYLPELADRMRAELRKAIELAPEFPESYHLLAFIDLVTDERLDEAVSMLKRAMQLAPGREDFALALAQVYMRREDFTAARQILEPIAQTSAEPQMRQAAESLLRTVRLIEEQRALYPSNERGERQVVPNAPTPNDEARPTPPRLPKRFEGTRVRGELIKIECGPRGVLLFVKTGERILRLHNADLQRIEFVSYIPNISGEITCGPRNLASPVAVTYHPTKDSRASFDGEVVAVEFVPPEWEIEP